MDRAMKELTTQVQVQQTAIKAILMMLEVLRPGTRALLIASVPTNDLAPKEQEMLLQLLAPPH